MSYDILNSIRSSGPVTQFVFGAALCLPKYPIEALATAALRGMKLTEIHPLTSIKTWKYLLNSRRADRSDHKWTHLIADIILPIFEECVLRGLLQPLLKKSAMSVMNPTGASVLSIVLMPSLCLIPHFFVGRSQRVIIYSPAEDSYKQSSLNGPLNFSALNRFVNAVFCGMAKELTGGLMAPIALQTVHNFLNPTMLLNDQRFPGWNGKEIIVS